MLNEDILVSGRGLEPPIPYGNYLLKVARLPISPPRLYYTNSSTKLKFKLLNLNLELEFTIVIIADQSWCRERESDPHDLAVAGF